ncbi:hypothetical protein MVEN_00176000 [Mycena venus]|uniref:DUF5648 domain-containing protein n=1 Tax=Mycena venus TaxID=2733690 RepID=A0A8H6Z0R7_9AGAR|nr:hypothetical protein MVEN_00176000 [Mycena venus]
MKSPFSLAFTTSALLLAMCAVPYASAESRSIEVKARDNSTCADPSTSVPFYFLELTSDNDFYTTSITDVTTRITQGYTLQGVVARVFLTEEVSTVPLYHVTRILNTPLGADDLYTVSTADLDQVIASGFYTFVGIAAYVYPSQICGSLPFYRLWEASTIRHWYTTSLEDRDVLLATGQWTDEGIEGYVLDASS